MESDIQAVVDTIEIAVEDHLPSDDDFLTDLEYLNDFGHEIINLFNEWSRIPKSLCLIKFPDIRVSGS